MVFLRKETERQRHHHKLLASPTILFYSILFTTILLVSLELIENISQVESGLKLKHDGRQISSKSFLNISSED